MIFRKFRNYFIGKSLRLKLLQFLIFLNFTTLSFSQENEELRLNATINQPLTDFLNYLSANYHITFYYQPGWFDGMDVKKTFNNTTVNAAIEAIFHDSQYTPVILQNTTVIIVPKQEFSNIITRSTSQSSNINDVQIVGKQADIGKSKRPEILGTVIDGKTGEPIIGATVAVQNSNYGAASDVNGNFTLNLAPGIYNLVVSSVGYEEKTATIKLIAAGNLSIELFEKSIKLEEVIVSRQKADKNVRGNQMSIVEMDKKMLKQIPPILGEKDVIKSVSLMPGVKSVGEFGSGINVRGGSNDQNLFLVEGAPVANTSHVFGLLSAINPDIVNNLTLYKGYIPPSYGERVSSVMDIQLKEGNFNEYRANGGIGLLNGRLMTEGPLVQNKASYIFSARSSYSDWLLKKLPDINLKHSSSNFYDINAGISIMPDNKSKIVGFVYASKDNFKYSNIIDYGYANIVGSLSWTYKLSDNTALQAAYAMSNYTISKDDIEQVYEKTTKTTGLTYNSLKIGFINTSITNNTIDFGLQSIYYQTSPGNLQPLDTASIIDEKKINEEQAIENAIYFGDQYDISEKLNIQGGIRTSFYALLGPGKVSLYESGVAKSTSSVLEIKNYASGKIMQTYFNLEPRLAIKYLMGEKSSLKLSYNRNVQNISLISYTSVATPDDIWKLSNKYVNPIKSDHFALGYFRNFYNNSIESSVELYYKRLTNVIDYKNGAQISMNENIETELINANGKNYGVEFLIKKSNGRLDGWFSYTYSRSLRQTNSNILEEQIKNNRAYPSSFDKPHDLTLMATYHYNKRIRFSGTFYYSTGRAVTLPKAKYVLSGLPVVDFTDRNQMRLPDYHRLDLSMGIDETLRLKRKWKGSWTFSVINVYWRKNTYTVIYKKKNIANSLKDNEYGLYKLFIIGQAIPTITYNFIF